MYRSMVILYAPLVFYRMNFIYGGVGGWKELRSSGIMSRTTIAWLMVNDELLWCIGVVGQISDVHVQL